MSCHGNKSGLHVGASDKAFQKIANGKFKIPNGEVKKYRAQEGSGHSHFFLSVVMESVRSLVS